MKIKLTSDMVCSINPTESKVYIFVEPMPAILKAYPLGRPDEHQGHHCISFLFASQEAVDQIMALTTLVVETHKSKDGN